MYERFTDRAKKIVQLANQEARRFDYDYVGSEHVLLGVVQEGTGVAAYVLKNLGIDLPTVQLEVEKLLSAGPKMAVEKSPQTQLANEVFESSMKQARELQHDYVGSEHLLLGLLSNRESVVSVMLTGHGVTFERVRAETLRLIGSSPIQGTD